jgi:hypothetical protein
MIDCQFFDGHAGAHHFINVLLHALSASVLFLVLRQMTGALWRSVCRALVCDSSAARRIRRLDR